MRGSAFLSDIITYIHIYICQVWPYKLIESNIIHLVFYIIDDDNNNINTDLI